MHFLLLLIVLVSGTAAAAPVTWTLENVTLTSGGAITGSFDYDADTNTYSNIAIESPCWYEMCPEYTGDSQSQTYSDWHEYIYGTLPAGGSIEPVSNMTSTSLSLATGAFGFGTFYGAELDLVFATALTNAGGMIALVPRTDYFGDLEYYNEYIAEDFYLASGTVTAVPIPAAVWLFGSALAGLGLIRRKQSI